MSKKHRWVDKVDYPDGSRRARCENCGARKVEEQVTTDEWYPTGTRKIVYVARYTDIRGIKTDKAPPCETQPDLSAKLCHAFSVYAPRGEAASVSAGPAELYRVVIPTGRGRDVALRGSAAALLDFADRIGQRRQR